MLASDDDQGGPMGVKTDGGVTWGMSADVDGTNACEVTGAACRTNGLGMGKEVRWGANPDL